jgi:hypothetical protein
LEILKTSGPLVILLVPLVAAAFSCARLAPTTQLFLSST